MLYLLLAQLLNKFRFPDSNIMQYILQIQRFTCSQQRFDIGAEIAMQLLFSLLMNGRPLSDIRIISDLSYINSSPRPHTSLFPRLSVDG